MKKEIIGEFSGTFLLVLFGTGAIVLNEYTGHMPNHLGISAAFGLSVFFMIIVFGKLSGSHINPAVSIALAANKSFRPKKLMWYVPAQIGGALLASLTLKLLFPASILLGSTMPSGSEMQSFRLEFFLTFILMLAVLKVPGERKYVAPFVIGSIIFLEAYFAGPICGASMNPARSLAPALISTHTEHVWIYLTAPVAGALTAVFLLKLLTPLFK